MAALFGPTVSFFYVRGVVDLEKGTFADCLQTIRFESIKENLTQEERLACKGFARLTRQYHTLSLESCQMEQDPSIEGDLGELQEKIEKIGSILNRLQTLLRNSGIIVSKQLIPIPIDGE